MLCIPLLLVHLFAFAFSHFSVGLLFWRRHLVFFTPPSLQAPWCLLCETPALDCAKGPRGQNTCHLPPLASSPSIGPAHHIGPTRITLLGLSAMDVDMQWVAHLTHLGYIGGTAQGCNNGVQHLATAAHLLQACPAPGEAAGRPGVGDGRRGCDGGGGQAEVGARLGEIHATLSSILGEVQHGQWKVQANEAKLKTLTETGDLVNCKHVTTSHSLYQ